MCSGCGMKFVRDNEQNNLIMRKNCNNESILSEGVVDKCKWPFVCVHLQNNSIQKKDKNTVRISNYRKRSY